jgi:hypothetical protein
MPALELFFSVMQYLVLEPLFEVCVSDWSREAASWILGHCGMTTVCAENALHSRDESSANCFGIAVGRALRNQEMCV